MKAIAWAIVIAGIYIAPFRNKADEGYAANNAFDCILMFVAIGMLIYFSFKS